MGKKKTKKRQNTMKVSPQSGVKSTAVMRSQAFTKCGRLGLLLALLVIGVAVVLTVFGPAWAGQGLGRFSVWATASLLGCLIFGLTLTEQVGASFRFLFFIAVYAVAAYLTGTNTGGKLNDPHSQWLLWNAAIVLSFLVGLVMRNKLGGILKWMLVLSLLVSLVSWGGVYSQKITELNKIQGVGGVHLLFYHSLPVVAWLSALVASFYILKMTDSGARAWKFFSDAKLEMYRVVWPTKQEVGQTTLMVVIFVIVVALFLWGVDSLFTWVITKITGLT